MKLIHQSQQQLQKLREIVITENMIKEEEISKKSKLEIKQLQQQMNQDAKNSNDYNKYLNEKYEKIEEQKNLNQFLEEQMRVIKSHKKDLRKAQALQETKFRSHSQHSKEKQKSLSKEREGISSEAWSQKLSDMKSKAEDNQKKIQYRNNFLKLEDQEEQNQNELDMYPKREFQSDQRRDHSQPSIKGPQKKQTHLQEKENEYYGKILEISQQDAWKQYEIHQSIKQSRRERLVDSQNYNQVEKALKNLSERVEPLIQQNQQEKKNAVFSGNLIGRATTKLIKVHHSKIIELLIEDLLYEMIAILSKEEANTSEVSNKLTRECLVNDYLDEFREMAYEQCEIVDRMKQTQTKKQEFFNFRHTTPHEQAALIIHPSQIQIENARVELSLGIMVNVFDKRSYFLRKIQKIRSLLKKNMNAFQQITEKLLDEILLDVSKELDDANGGYAELMFNHEFK